MDQFTTRSSGPGNLLSGLLTSSPLPAKDLLLKELQSLALDVRVLRDDNTEVKIMESVDYGDTNLNHIIEGDRYSDREDERFGDYGFSKKEFDGEEMVDVEEDEEEDSYLDLDESSDDDM